MVNKGDALSTFGGLLNTLARNTYDLRWWSWDYANEVNSYVDEIECGRLHSTHIERPITYFADGADKIRSI